MKNYENLNRDEVIEMTVTKKQGGKMKHTYINEFHHTEARSKYSPDDFADYYAGTRGGSWAREEKMERAAKRLRDKLCGISDCQCGDWLGVRN